MTVSPSPRTTVIINKTTDAYVVTSTQGATGTQYGELPLSVRAFREVAARVKEPEFQLEPGSALAFSGFPSSLRIRISPAFQRQWMTFEIMHAAAEQARDSLPNLIFNNEKYRSAASTCMDAASRTFITATDGPYKSQTLIESIGLGSKSTQCGLDLVSANNERKLLAAPATSLGASPPPDLPLNLFAHEASSVAGRIDQGIAVSNKIVQIFR
ncbi:hypothetical protein [Pseudonocardia sediminis]|nr:hypothetical protein [Pseudonocardia sediminis]